MTSVKVEHWYVGVQNDGLFIIDKPPSPSGTDVVWEGRKDLKVIAIVEDRETFAETERNANLLAAAPKMLEALKKIAEARHSGCSTGEAISKSEFWAREAIQEAEVIRK